MSLEEGAALKGNYQAFKVREAKRILKSLSPRALEQLQEQVRVEAVLGGHSSLDPEVLKIVLEKRSTK